MRHDYEGSEEMGVTRHRVTGSGLALGLDDGRCTGNINNNNMFGSLVPSEVDF